MAHLTPCSEQALLANARALIGTSIATLAARQGTPLPQSRRNAKGFIGILLEDALGADAGNLPIPDFPALGIELKTIPVSVAGDPRESTYVCVAPRAGKPWGAFEDSLLWRKLACVLFVPVISSSLHTLGETVIGTPRLWRPDGREQRLMAADWQLLAENILSGAPPDGRLGEVLQLRPKGAHGRDLRPGADAEGLPSRALPMGFYLRATFTRSLLTESV